MDNFEVELSRCDEEQIQFIATIQNFGTLLVAGRDRKIIIAAVDDQIRLSNNEALGANIEELLPAVSERVYDALDGRSEPNTPLLIRSKKLDRWVSCIAHKQNDLTIFEIEVVPAQQNDIPSVKFMKERKDSLESYLSYIAENVRSITGYDRVMIYRFSSDWHGEVIAESTAPDVQRFYGHHFPASDIPAPARALFLQNWVRMIADVDAPQLPLIGAEIKLDLTRSVLRAPAGIHLEYLRNMGVAASLTLSLICDGKLWGLIACHHLTPNYVGAEQRSVLSLVAKVVSSRITSLSVGEVVASTERIADFMRVLNQQLLAGSANISDCVRDFKNNLWRMIDSDGYIFIAGADVISDGHSLGSSQARDLVKVLEESGASLVHTSCISSLFPQLSELSDVAAGFIAIKVEVGWLIWNRHEVVHSVTWAGNPTKQIDAQRTHASISPRQSFQSWKEQVRGISKSWQQHDIQAASSLQEMLLHALARKKYKEPAREGEYLRVLRQSIQQQTADLQNHFSNLNLSDSLPPD